MTIITEEMRFRKRLCDYALKYVLTIKRQFRDSFQLLID